MRRSAALVSVSALLLVGACGTDDPPEEPLLTEQPDQQPPPEELEADPEDAEPGTDADAGAGAIPELCEQVDAGPGDTFTVDEAGEVQVTRGDGGLELGDVTAQEGWEHDVREETEGRIEVAFTRTDDTAGSEVIFILADEEGLIEQDDPLRAEVCTAEDETLD